MVTDKSKKREWAEREFAAIKHDHDAMRERLKDEEYNVEVFEDTGYEPDNEVNVEMRRLLIAKLRMALS